MALNIIELIKGQLGPATITQAASQLGESESGISKAVNAFLPAIIGAFANNADKPEVLDSITNASSKGILGNLLGAASNNTMITSLLSSFFGDKMSTVADTVSAYAGISNSSCNSVMNMVTGAAVGSISKYASDNNLDASGISSLLEDQKEATSLLVPAGLSLASLSAGNWAGSDIPKDTPSFAGSDEHKIEVNRSGNTNSHSEHADVEESGSILKWLLPLLLLALAAWFLWKQINKQPQASTTSATDSTAIISDTMNNPIPLDSGTATINMNENIDLNGTALQGNKGGLEDSMITFLKSGNYKNAADDAALKDSWYTFDKVNFKIGSASELEEESQVQMDNLLAILKAYPDAKIKIGGYTDKVGNEASNVKLSQERADYIKKWLSEKGVAAQILGAEGYGSKFSTIAATATNEERAVDRKMAVRFAK
jgi:outer membrane protein OmpA-like peptidoglycan-associated protein